MKITFQKQCSFKEFHYKFLLKICLLPEKAFFNCQVLFGQTYSIRSSKSTHKYGYLARLENRGRGSSKLLRNWRRSAGIKYKVSYLVISGLLQSFLKVLFFQDIKVWPIRSVRSVAIRRKRVVESYVCSYHRNTDFTEVASASLYVFLCLYAVEKYLRVFFNVFATSFRVLKMRKIESLCCKG